MPALNRKFADIIRPRDKTSRDCAVIGCGQLEQRPAHITLWGAPLPDGAPCRGSTENSGLTQSLSKGEALRVGGVRRRGIVFHGRLDGARYGCPVELADK